MMIHRTYRTRFSRSIAFNQILLGSKCCQIESVSIKHCSKRTATNHFSPGGANLPVNIVGIPHRKLPQKIRYKPGQFFIHEKTPYRGIIVENLHTNVFKLDEEKNLPVEENKVFYKVLIDFTDLENSKNRPSSEIQIKERWAETIRPNRNASRFTLESLAGFDVVAHEDIYPFTPFMPGSQHKNRDTDGSIKRGDPYESVETPPADEDHRTQFNLPSLQDYRILK